MSALEKKQVVSFLKILQIPTDKSPEEIKRSLLGAGWNEKDASEAVTVLYPHTEDAEPVEGEVRPSQIVAQKYVQPEDDAVSTIVTKSSVESTVEQPLTESEPAEQSTEMPSKITSVLSAEAQALADGVIEDDPGRPHTDAPWLKDQVDIYDVTPEEREEMIRTVYRTNERLSPQTIHALLGIDVDLSEFESAYQKRINSGLSWIQIAIIFVLSVLIATVSLFYGMYYFEVGLFHPSITSGL